MDKIVERNSTTLYDGLLTIREDGLVMICDKDFESSIAFINSLMFDLIESYKESPEYFTDDILISVYHYFQTKEVAHANEVAGDIEAKIIGRDACLDIEYAGNLVDDGFQWIDFDMDEKKKIIAQNIAAALLD